MDIETAVDDVAHQLNKELSAPFIRKVECEFLTEDALNIYVWLEPDAPAAICQDAFANAKTILIPSIPDELSWGLVVYKGFEVVASFNPEVDEM